MKLLKIRSIKLQSKTYDMNNIFISKSQRFCILIFLLIHISISAQESILYSPRWYGPNANPIPEERDASIPDGIKFSSKFLFQLSLQDKSQSFFTDLEIPIIPQKASVRIYGYAPEWFQWSKASMAQRAIPDHLQKGCLVGDIYLQTRLRLLRENNTTRPNIVLNYTLKTASPKHIANECRRFFDTPGYFFHIEVGKNLLSSKTYPFQLRLCSYLGFMCWETIQSQNDAFMYNISLAALIKKCQLKAQFGGYNGWQKHRYGADFGDEPIHCTLSCDYKITPCLTASCGVEKGLRDYPFTQFFIGMSYNGSWNILRWKD